MDFGLSRRTWVFAAALAAAVAAAAPAQALIEFDQNVTPDVIFGSGNANGSFTTDRQNNVELGLRAKLRFDAANTPQNIFNSLGNGSYRFEAGLPPTGFGFAPGSTSTAVWNFEWTINTDLDGTSGRTVGDLTYLLQIDFDPTIGTNFLAFDPINPGPADHAFGDNSTANGGGTGGTPANYATLLSTSNVVQNSWNMEFFDNAPSFPFDGRVRGVYDFILTALDGGSEVASTQIRVLTVPEPATLLLLLSGLLGLGLIGWRRRTTEGSAAAT